MPYRYIYYTTFHNIDFATFNGTADANGWNIYILPNGKKLWYKKATANWQVAANTWVIKDHNAPVGIKNADICVGSGVAADNAIRVTVGCIDTSFSIRLKNDFNSSVTTDVTWQAIFIET